MGRVRCICWLRPSVNFFSSSRLNLLFILVLIDLIVVNYVLNYMEFKSEVEKYPQNIMRLTDCIYILCYLICCLSEYILIVSVLSNIIG